MSPSRAHGPALPSQSWSTPSAQSYRLLSQYRPPAYPTGCTQGVWTRGRPLLVRNYDYAPALWEGLIWKTGWLGREVLGASDSLWGLLDGVNDAGLCLSLSFGGRRVVGDGFGIPLILRYALQVCDTTAEAVAVLRRVPCHMAYTVTALDAAGSFATVFLNPDRPAVAVDTPNTTNHQLGVEWPEHAASTHSLERLQVLDDALAEPGGSAEGFVERFAAPPVWSDRHAKGTGTLYTAIYSPLDRSVTFRWPHAAWTLSLAGFYPEAREVTLVA